ncbi:helix-turn-helix domain-containing protein [Isoptericola sp. b441]|uniref:Helix-turn-helix domain-containing protein n=1 Tax=Actinotalea lenta TaxID=3064654 RepID=A0ABT9D6Y0_9CELL|nr:MULTISPECIES: TetR/AcrR family transcriptional regulator [unclassified Isoptericola]MDO8106285.1 helix-turn-helix domain-containing protein [Isoptericola sp. b441]MDO8121995.1 helix-turn-helix domain-containing protein [Isoptericola sp. b490]
MAARRTPEERRATLLAAARDVFAQAGYPAASVADVAALAGVSEPLVFRYFPTKAELHAAVLRSWAQDLGARQDAAVSAVPEGAPVRDRVRALLEVLLDDAAAGARWWLEPASFPSVSVAVVADARAALARTVRDLLPPSWGRHDYALESWPGFVEAAVRTWVGRGCPADDRGHVQEATLGALQGALGDWGR